MFCVKCGSPLDDGAAACPKCGAPVNWPQTPPQQVPPEQVPPQQVPPQQVPPQQVPPQQVPPQQPPQQQVPPQYVPPQQQVQQTVQSVQSKVKQFVGPAGTTTIGGVTIPLSKNQLMGAVGLVAVVVVVLALIMSSAGSGASNAAEKFIQSVFKGNANAVVSLLPGDLIDELCDRGDMTKKEFTNELKDTLDDVIEDLQDEYGKFSIKTEVTKDKEMKRSDVKTLTERYERNFGVDLDIDEAHEVTVKTTVKYGKEEESKKLTLTAIKVKGKWYVDYYSMSSVF